MFRAWTLGTLTVVLGQGSNPTSESPGDLKNHDFSWYFGARCGDSLQPSSQLTPENPLSPFRSVKSAGFEFFRVEIESFCHGFSVALSVFRRLGRSCSSTPAQRQISAWVCLP